MRPGDRRFQTARRRLLALFAGVFAALGANRSSAVGDDELVVVVHRSHPASRLTRADLRPLFLTTRGSWPDGRRAIPINLPEKHDLRVRFDEVVLGMTPAEVAKYWTDRRIRGGARPPARQPTSQAVVRVVADEPGAVGYARRGDVTSQVKVVAVIRGNQVEAP